MKVKLLNTTFDAFQFVRHRFEELPSWARTYSVQHGADTAHLYRHHTQNRVFVPAVGGGHIPATTDDYLLWDGETITVVSSANFKRRYKVVPDDYPPILICERRDDDR